MSLSVKIVFNQAQKFWLNKLGGPKKGRLSFLKNYFLFINLTVHFLLRLFLFSIFFHLLHSHFRDFELKISSNQHS